MMFIDQKFKLNKTLIQSSKNLPIRLETQDDKFHLIS